MSMRKYCRVAGRGLCPVMADQRNKIRRATQQERKVRASTILKFNSSYCALKEFGRTKAVTINKIRLCIQALNAKKGRGGTKKERHFKWNALVWRKQSLLVLVNVVRSCLGHILFQLSSALMRFCVTCHRTVRNICQNMSCNISLNDQNIL